MQAMYNAIIASIDLSMENERGRIAGHMLLFCPDNQPRRFESRSSNPGAVAALDFVYANMQPRHLLRPNDHTGVHKLTSTHWVVECADTGTYSLYHRLARYAMSEEAIGGKYSVSFRLASCDYELHLGTIWHYYHFHLYVITFCLQLFSP